MSRHTIPARSRTRSLALALLIAPILVVTLANAAHAQVGAEAIDRIAHIRAEVARLSSELDGVYSSINRLRSGYHKALTARRTAEKRVAALESQFAAGTADVDALAGRSDEAGAKALQLRIAAAKADAEKTRRALEHARRTRAGGKLRETERRAYERIISAKEDRVRRLEEQAPSSIDARGLARARSNLSRVRAELLPVLRDELPSLDRAVADSREKLEDAIARRATLALQRLGHLETLKREGARAGLDDLFSPAFLREVQVRDAAGAVVYHSRWADPTDEASARVKRLQTLLDALRQYQPRVAADSLPFGRVNLRS